MDENDTEDIEDYNVPEYDEVIEVKIKRVDRMLLRIVPSSLSSKEKLERIPGGIFSVNEEIADLTTRGEELKNSVKFLEDKEFMTLKAEGKPDGKKYTIDEARVQATENLKNHPTYQDRKRDRQKNADYLFEKRNLLELLRDMQKNARVLIEAEVKK
jgi:hypothetical protein